MSKDNNHHHHHHKSNHHHHSGNSHNTKVSYTSLRLRSGSSDSTRHAFYNTSQSPRQPLDVTPLESSEPRSRLQPGEVSPVVDHRPTTTAATNHYKEARKKINKENNSLEDPFATTRTGSYYFQQNLYGATNTTSDSLRYSIHDDTPHSQQQFLQQAEIHSFSRIAIGGRVAPPPPSQWNNASVPRSAGHNSNASLSVSSESSSSASTSSSLSFSNWNFYQCLLSMLDPTDWLKADLRYDELSDTYVFDDKWTLASLIRLYLYNPIQPEFDSLQLFCWGIVIGLFMGLYCSFWKYWIESGVDFWWETVPNVLYSYNILTDTTMFHYIWMVPALFGGILSYIFCILPTKIPDQNEWIKNVHARGVQDSETFGILFVLSTLGMWSGLSLGPELPLVLTAGMVGSHLAIITNQSMLHARVLNLTAAGAAVGGFFGFPMAGALFVLELPHCDGLQYFEALSPGIVASIVAVLTNRIVTGNDVTGYFRYPFLSLNLPSIVFICAVFYGLYGYVVGTVYCRWVKRIKSNVHDWFHVPHHDDHSATEASGPKEVPDETMPLVGGSSSSPTSLKAKISHKNENRHPWWALSEEPKRAAVAGTLAGALVGIIGIFVPHIMFWGEAQLQNLIDKGRTPLPVFGGEGEHVEALTAHAWCMIDSNDPEEIAAGFGVGCSLLISISKTIVIGLSLGTGIIGGHFWGPLYVGCAASHLLTDIVNLVDQYVPLGPCKTLSAYPCLVILCTMGAAHVVTFRAHVAIMLILTLTISGFDPENENNSFQVAGDYSAVFPLLVVSVFLSLYCSRGTKFYPTQRPRGDITAIAEVLCRPGKEGAPLVVGYEQSTDELSNDSEGSYYQNEGSSDDINTDAVAAVESDLTDELVRRSSESLTADDIEKAFQETIVGNAPLRKGRSVSNSPAVSEKDTFASTKPFLSTGKDLSDKRLNELLGIDPDGKTSTASNPGKAVSEPNGSHRHSRSAPLGVLLNATHTRSSSRDSAAAGAATPGRDRLNSQNSMRGSLVEVTSFGHIEDHQPALLDQARARAALHSPETMHRRIPSTDTPGIPRAHRRTASGRHSRNQSGSSIGSFGLDMSEVGGSLLMDDLQNSFSEIITETVIPRARRNMLPRQDSKSTSTTTGMNTVNPSTNTSSSRK